VSPAFALTLLSLLACHPKTKSFGSGDDSAGNTNVLACDPAVTIPWGTSGSSSDPIAADPGSAVFGTDTPDPYAVHLGFPSRDMSHSVSMLWRTDVDTLASQVQLGLAKGFPDNASTVDGSTFLYGGGETGTGIYRMHELRLCDALQPATTYSYRVGGEGHWSDSYSFTTPGEAGTMSSFRVAIAGDSRGSASTWGDLVAAMETHAPDLYVFSGDMVQLGASQPEWDEWFAAAGDLMARKPLLAAHGNHEFLAQNYFAQFGFPGNEEWYGVDYGDLLLVSLNDTVRSEYDIDTTEQQFLAGELTATTRPWRVVTHHQPEYSASSAHGSDEVVRAAWGGTIDAGGVQLVLNGHNHLYERTVPIKDGQEVASGEGTVYVVSGGAGAPLYSGMDDNWFDAVSNSTHNYVIADFGPKEVQVVAYDLDGNVLDDFTVPR